MTIPEFDETTITDAVLDQVRRAPNPRIRQISEALVRHLHAFIREVEPTEAEWEWGIRFLTRQVISAPRRGRNSFCCPTRWGCRCWSMRSIIACPAPRPRR